MIISSASHFVVHTQALQANPTLYKACLWIQESFLQNMTFSLSKNQGSNWNHSKVKYRDQVGLGWCTVPKYHTIPKYLKVSDLGKLTARNGSKMAVLLSKVALLSQEWHKGKLLGLSLKIPTFQHFRKSQRYMDKEQYALCTSHL